MTDIGVMVRSANPVPDESQQLTDDELSAVLLLAQQRSGDMDVKELTKPVEPEGSSRPGWLIAALAFGAIIVVVGAAMLLTGDGSAELTPATTPPTTQAVPTTTVAPAETVEEPAVEEQAEPAATVSAGQLAVISAYEAAINSGDVERIVSMLGSGFRYTDESAVGQGWFTSAEAWINEQMVHIMEGSRVSYTDCELEGTVVSCLETWSGPIKNAITGGDWTYQADFVLEDGVVASMHGLALQWPQGSVHNTFYEGMIEWAGDVAPEDAAVLAGCEIDAGNQDLDLWPLCVDWAQRWLDAGRP